MHIVVTGLFDDDPDDTPLDTLELSVRSYNVLRRNGVSTVGQLLALRQSDLLRFPHFNLRCYEEIRKQLIVHNFMDSIQPIGPFVYDGTNLLQIPWQQVHIFCAIDNLTFLVNKLQQQFMGQEWRVKITNQITTRKQHSGCAIVEWRDHVDADFLEQLINDDDILDFYLYDASPDA